MIWLLVIFSAGVVLGFGAGLGAGLWSCGKDEQSG